MFLPERGGFLTAPFHIGTSFGITSSVHYPSPPSHLVLLLLLTVLQRKTSVPSSSSYSVTREGSFPLLTLWLKPRLQRKNKTTYIISHDFFYIFYTIISLLYWLCCGFSMASSRGSCKESYPSFLNSCKSPVQGLAMLKSRHIPASEIIWFS